MGDFAQKSRDNQTDASPARSASERDASPATRQLRADTPSLVARRELQQSLNSSPQAQTQLGREQSLNQSPKAQSLIQTRQILNSSPRVTAQARAALAISNRNPTAAARSAQTTQRVETPEAEAAPESLLETGALQRAAMPVAATPDEDKRQARPVAPGKDGRGIVQGIFTVAGKKYTSENKDELGAVPAVAKWLAETKVPAYLDKLETMAGVIDDFGTLTWEDLLPALQVEVKKDAGEFLKAAYQVLARFPPEQYAYIGLGGSPDPLMRALKTQYPEAVSLVLPFSNLSDTVVATYATESLGANQEALEKRLDETEKLQGAKPNTKKEHPIFAQDKLNQSLKLEEELKTIKTKDLPDDKIQEARIRLHVLRPLMYNDIIGAHLDQFVARQKLQGLTKVLLIDFANSGMSLKMGARMLTKYYGGHVAVTPFALTAADTQLPAQTERITAQGNVNVARLSKALEGTTYKKSHRLNQRFDMLDVAVNIQNYVKSRLVEGDDEIEAPSYEKPQDIAGAEENIDKFLALGADVSVK